jgi:hypothetical protein
MVTLCFAATFVWFLFLILILFGFLFSVFGFVFVVVTEDEQEIGDVHRTAVRWNSAARQGHAHNTQAH